MYFLFYGDSMINLADVCAPTRQQITLKLNENIHAPDSDKPTSNIVHIAKFLSFKLLYHSTKLSTFPIVFIFFPLLCASDVCYIIFCHLLHIRSGKPGICSHYYCAVYYECKYSDTFWLADRTRLFVQNTISLSSLCKLIWCLSDIYLSSVWVRLSIFSPLSIIQYVGLYVFRLPISLVMIEKIYILCLIIIIKSEVWTIIHCLGLGHETMVSAVCLSIF